jgi:hypothetical protein
MGVARFRHAFKHGNLSARCRVTAFPKNAGKWL